MKKYHLISLFLSIAFIVISGYYVNEVQEARSKFLIELIGNDSGFLLDDNEADELTNQIALLSLIFIPAFIFLDYLKIKLQKNKRINIVAISLSVILLIWDFLVLSNPGALSFDEVGPAWIGYAFLMLIFSSLGLLKLNKGNT